MAKVTKKHREREIEKEIDSELSKKQLITMLTGTTRAHMDLVKWLYDTHRDILREYEKTKGNIQIHFGGEDGSKDS